jgi:hypothetical protein
MLLQCNAIDMFGGQRRVASATDQSGAIPVASYCQAVGDQIAFECGLADDGRLANAVHWVKFGHGSGLDRQSNAT